MLHGSRGGHQVTRQQEYDGTRNYAVNEPNGLGWNVTVGDDQVAIHMTPAQWGWHARAVSPHALSVEFAQPLESYDITDEQVHAFAWWLRNYVFVTWPSMRQAILDDSVHKLPTHAEVENWGWTGVHDGKTDAFSYGSPKADDLRARIVALL